MLRHNLFDWKRFGWIGFGRITLPTLNQREVSILQRLSAGDDNLTIAQTLSLSPKTVRNYISRLLKKLAANDRTVAATIAREKGLIE